MPDFVMPYALIFFRVIGSTLLFWLFGLFIKSKKIERQDYPRLAVCALLGTSVNMLFFYKGLNTALPIVASAIAVGTPLMVFVFSVILTFQNIQEVRLELQN